jgi:hypothetical protein
MCVCVATDADPMRATERRLRELVSGLALLCACVCESACVGASLSVRVCELVCTAHVYTLSKNTHVC